VVVSRLKKLQIFTQKKMLVGKAKGELRTGINQNQYIMYKSSQLMVVMPYFSKAGMAFAQ
jgi:hypothetical protein